jgi:hypothetical protein
MHSELLLRLWLYCLGMLFSLSSILCKKKGGFSEESLLRVKGLGKSVVGYAISFICRGWFCFLLPVGFTMVTVGICYGRLHIYIYIMAFLYSRVAPFSLTRCLFYSFLSMGFECTVGEFRAVGFRMFLMQWAVCLWFPFFFSFL